MSERRMFSKKIVSSDAFIEMPLSAQALYFHLGMQADDDGFVNATKRTQRIVGASDDDLRILIEKRFILCFEDGIVVIKHWRINNRIRKDRYTPTPHQDQLSRLAVKENGAYTEKECGNHLVTTWQPDGNQMVTQYSIVKYSIDKDSIGECEGEDVSDETPPTPQPKPEPKSTQKKFKEPSIAEVRAYCAERSSNIDPERFVNYYTANGWMVGRKKMKDWKAAVRYWEKGSQFNSQRKNIGSAPVIEGDIEF